MPETPYHGWTLPVVDESEDKWGEELNAVFGLEELDTEVIKKGPTTGTPPKPTVSAGTADRWYLGTDTTDPTDSQASLPWLFYDDGDAWITIWDGDAKTLGGNDASSYLSTGDTIDADELGGTAASEYATKSYVDSASSSDTNTQQRTLSVAEVDIDAGEALTIGWVNVPNGQTAYIEEIQIADPSGDSLQDTRLEVYANSAGYLGGTNGPRSAGSPLFSVSGADQVQFFVENSGSSTAAASAHAIVRVD